MEFSLPLELREATYVHYFAILREIKLQQQCPQLLLVRVNT